MAVNLTRAWLILATVAVVAVGAAYLIDSKREVRPAVAPKAGPVAGGAPALPAAHPPVAAVKPPPDAPLRAGKVDKVDPARAFTDFRVGNNSVLAIHADGDVIWLGTSGGIVRYDTNGREFKTYDSRDGLNVNGILFVGKVQGRIAAGTYGGGLSMLDPDSQRWDHVTVADGLGDPFVYDALETSGGDLWIATGAGVNRVRGGALKDRSKWERFSVQSTAGGLPHNRVFRIAKGGDGSVWFATGGGVANFRNGEWTRWTHADGIGAPAPVAGNSPMQEAAASGAAKPPNVNPNQVAALEVTRDGGVWVGTRGGGVARFDGKVWNNYTVRDGLPSDQISTLATDRDGLLWAGTQGGLAYFKDGKFRTLKVSSALLAQGVLSLKTTRAGDLWAGGFGGVAQIRSAALN